MISWQKGTRIRGVVQLVRDIYHTIQTVHLDHAFVVMCPQPVIYILINEYHCMVKKKKVSPFGPKGVPVTYKQHLALKKKARAKKEKWDGY